MNHKNTELAVALDELEQELHLLGVWSTKELAPEALKSIQPFAVDTLTLPQWLQFIFLPKIRELLENNQKLPENCNIEPIAQIFFQGTRLDAKRILSVLQRLDALFAPER